MEPIMYKTTLGDGAEITITPLEIQEKVSLAVVDHLGTITVLALTREQAGEIGTSLLNAVEDINKNKRGGI